MTDLSEPIVFDPLRPDFVRDPYPFYRRLREQAPIHRDHAGFWVFTRHADVSALLRDRRLRRNFDDLLQAFYGGAWREEAVWGYPLETVLFANPPRHARLRAVLAKAFSAPRIEAQRAEARALAEALLDRFEPRGGMDLRADFAYPLAMGVICTLLGLPREEAPWIAREVESLMPAFEARPLGPSELKTANAALATLADYFGRFFEARRAVPGEDLLSALCQLAAEGEGLTPEEMTANVIMLFTAGYETTANQICNGMIALHRHPEQLARLRADPRADAAAVEELYRYDTSAQIAARAAAVDMEIEGHRIGAGEMLCLVIGAANRDPEVYPDPDRLDLSRSGQRALTFGGGPHFCLGARLSRIEAEEAFSALFRRLPHLRPAELDSLRWRAGSVLRGVEALPVQW